MSACGDAGVDFATFLGPQDVRGHVEAKIRYYNLKVAVVRGAKMRLVQSANKTLTCENGTIVRVERPTLDRDRLYVWARLELKGSTGYRIYECAVRVRGGKLKEAVITVCVPSPPSITDPYQAYYELPRGMHVDEGDLDCEVILFDGK